MGRIMGDFASSTLVAAAQRGLADDGIIAVAPKVDGALLPFDAKRRFLTGIAREYGLLPLLRVGLVLPKIPPDPVVSALLKADTPLDLFQRWRRLERFIHSRHRVALQEASERDLLAEHIGPPGTPPEPAEDALVLGMLTVLLVMTGARDLTVTVGRDDPLIVFADGDFRTPPPDLGIAFWRFTWTSVASPARIGAASTGTDMVSRARHLLAGNLARRWTLGDLADEVGSSARSLQRRLQGDGGFQRLLGAVRTETAANLLLNSEYALPIVGFVCGYADQPHFTRDFKHRTAATPAAYRSAFTKDKTT